MKPTPFKILSMALALGSSIFSALAQTSGTLKIEVTVNDYTGSSSTKHWAVVWATYDNGTFIKSLRKQGPSWTSTHWDSHCGTWNTARGGSASGSQALDGYSSATAADYAGTNSPITWNWNCRDASNVLLPDGNYRIWVQYAEDAGQGPYTTGGLRWTKGSSPSTTTYPNQGANFTNMRLTWTPTVVTVPPTITSAPLPATATVGVPYNYTCTASGTTPIGFIASGLPAGLGISSSGVVSGVPATQGTFSGTVTAANGTAPNATQAFSIAVGVVSTLIGPLSVSGNNLTMSGQGPANGVYALEVSTDVTSTGQGQWTSVATNSFDASGQFSETIAINPSFSRQFYRLRVP